MEQANKRIVKNTLYLYVRSLLMLMIGLFSSRIILQVLGVEDYGLYGAVGSVVSLFVLVNGVLTASTSRFLTFELGVSNVDKLAKTFSAAFIMHFLLAIILFILLESIGLWFLNTQLTIPEGRELAANIVYQFSIISSMLSLTQVPYGAIIVSYERMNVVAYVGLLEGVFKILMIIILLYVPFSDNLILYAFIIFVWDIGLMLWYRYYCIKEFPECRLRMVKEKSIYKSMLSYSLWDFIGQFCASGNSQGVNILINLFFGVTYNASRAIAYQVENTIIQFVSNFMTAVQPQIVKAYAQRDLCRFFRLTFDSGKYSFFLLFLLTLPVFLESEYIISLWLVEVPELTVLFLRCIMAISLINIMDRPIINAVHATGNVKTLNLTSGIYASVTFLPLVYLLYSEGFPVWSCFVVQAFNSLVCMWLRVRALHKQAPFPRKDYYVNVFCRSIGVSMLACVIPFCIFSCLEPGPIRLILVFIFSFLSTAICVLYLGLNSQIRNKLYIIVLKRLYLK